MCFFSHSRSFISSAMCWWSHMVWKIHQWFSPLETVMATAEASYLVLSPHEAFPWNPRKDPHVWSMKNPIQEHLKTHQNHIKSSFFIEFCWVLIPIIGMLIPIFYPWNHEIPTGGLFFVDASPDISNRVSFLHTAGGCTAAAAIDVQTWRFYVGGFNPLNGKDYPIYYGKIKNVPNHQSVHIYIYIYIYIYICKICLWMQVHSECKCLGYNFWL